MLSQFYQTGTNYLRFQVSLLNQISPKMKGQSNHSYWRNGDLISSGIDMSVIKIKGNSFYLCWYSHWPFEPLGSFLPLYYTRWELQIKQWNLPLDPPPWQMPPIPNLSPLGTLFCLPACMHFFITPSLSPTWAVILTHYLGIVTPAVSSTNQPFYSP